MMKDGVHVRPLVGAVEDNLVCPGRQLLTFGLISFLHVLTTDILNKSVWRFYAQTQSYLDILYLLLPDPAPLPDVPP